MDYQDLQEHYRTLSDDEIEELALHASTDLLPEARQVLREEINRRHLSRVWRSTDIQGKGIGDGDVAGLVKSISQFPCPVCGSTRNPLNVFTVMRVRSYLSCCDVYYSMMLACPRCISKRGRRETRGNIFLGWWSVMGVGWTIEAIRTNRRAINSPKQTAPTQAFFDFVEPRAATAKERLERASTIHDLFIGDHPCSSPGAVLEWHDFDGVVPSMHGPDVEEGYYRGRKL